MKKLTIALGITILALSSLACGTAGAVSVAEQPKPPETGWAQELVLPGRSAYFWAKDGTEEARLLSFSTLAEEGKLVKLAEGTPQVCVLTQDEDGDYVLHFCEDDVMWIVVADNGFGIRVAQ